MACTFDWHVLYSQQLHSFDGHKAHVVEVYHDQNDSLRYLASEVHRRGLVDSVAYSSFHTSESIEAAKLFKKGECAFVFLDCEHTYEATKSNLEAWWEKVHYNSMLAGHGAGNSDVMKAVNEFFSSKNLPVRINGSCWILNHCHKPRELW